MAIHRQRLESYFDAARIPPSSLQSARCPAETMPRSNVVITGTGVVTSIGVGSEDFFQGLLENRSGITSLANRTDGGATPGTDGEPAGLWIGGPILEFDAKQYVRPRKALKVMCREIQLAYAASSMAIEDAGLSQSVPAVESDIEGTGEDDSGVDRAGHRMLAPHEIGTVFGSEMFYGPPSEMEDAMRRCMGEDGRIDESQFGGAAMKQVMPLWMLKYLPNMPACHVGIALNAHGPNNSLILGDVSGPAAVIEAASCIQRATARVMLAGGIGTRINTTRMNYRGDLPIPEVADPLWGSSRPHDPASKGVVGGEGAATVVLEDSAHAKQRGARPLAAIVAYACRFVPSLSMHQVKRSSETRELGSRGATAAIQSAIEGALADANLSASQIGLVVSHGMGDPAMDAAEQAALRATVPEVPVTATIAAIGHSGAACGAIDLVTAALSLAKRTVPPTVGSQRGRSGCPLRSKPEPLRGSHVLCLAHTPEGNAMAIVLGQP